MSTAARFDPSRSRRRLRLGLLGVGVTAVFGEGTLAAARITAARRNGRPAETAADALVVVLAGIVCVAVIVVGFVAMLHKS